MNLENLTPLNSLSPGTAVRVIPESRVETKGEQASAIMSTNFKTSLPEEFCWYQCHFFKTPLKNALTFLLFQFVPANLTDFNNYGNDFIYRKFTVCQSALTDKAKRRTLKRIT